MTLTGICLQTICILLSLTLVTSEETVYDYDYNENDLPDYDPSGDTDYYASSWSLTLDEIVPNLKNHSDLVAKLYGNEYKDQEEFWRQISGSLMLEGNCGLRRISLLERLKALSINESALEEDDRETLVYAADQDIAQVIKWQNETECSELYDRLRTSGSHLKCALGEKEFALTLTDILIQESPECWKMSQEFWKKLLLKGDFNAKCNATLVYSDVTRVAKIINKMMDTFGSQSQSEFNEHQEQLGGALVAAVSSPSHVEYLTSSTCPDAAYPWDCLKVMVKSSGVLCMDVSIQPVFELEKLVKNSRSKPFDSFEEAEAALEILEEVTEIVHVMSVADNIMPRFASMSVSSLDIYMDIMDRTIGKSSEKMWSQLSEDEAKHQLTRILGNNDKYVWSMSRIFFSSQGHKSEPRDLTKESMALKLWKFDADQSASKNIAFDFKDAVIQTNFGGDAATTKGLNVYAIHYETLAQLAVNSTSPNLTKEFVGKGGIISLSAHHETNNVSIPVTYRMNFQQSDFSKSGARSVCLSCEYLDLETGNWSNTGCSVSSVDNGGVTCDCSHTTNFAAFMSPVEIQYEMTQAQYQAQKIVSYIGSALSVLALTMCLIIFNVVKPSLRNERVKAHISLTFALLMVHMTQLASDLVINTNAACLISAVVTHYFLLAAFLWMLIEGIFLYLYVVQVFVHSSIEYLRMIYALGWIVPGVIVIISASIGIPSDTYLELQPLTCGKGESLYPPIPGINQKFKRCWLSTTSGMAFSFIVPALVIIAVNSVILGKVFQVLMRVSRKNRRTNRPFAPASSFSSHNNKAFSKKEQIGRLEQKSDSVFSSHKSINDSESSYGSTSLMTSKVAAVDRSSPSSSSAISPDKKASPQHYMHNPSYPRKQQSSAHEGETSNKKFIGDARTALKGALVLLPILGIPWICGLWVASNYVLTMIFIVLNSTQGIFIFVVYCLMNGEVMRALRRQVKVAKLRSSSGRSRVGSTSSLKSLNSKFAFSWRTKSTSDK